MNRFKMLGALGVALAATTSAHAEQTAYRNYLIGERATGLGGAFTAIADDPSGAYHNPAGLAYAESDYISLSTNAFQTASARYEGVFGQNRDYNLSAGSLTTSFFGFTQSMGPGKFAFVIVTEDYELTNQNDLITGISTEPGKVSSYSRQLTREQSAYLIGPSYAYALTPKVSIGLSLFMSYQHEKGMTQELVEFVPDTTHPEYFMQMAYISRDNFGVKPKLGVVWSPYHAWSLGFTVARNIPIHGSGKYEARSAPTKDGTTGEFRTPDGTIENDVNQTSADNIYSQRVSPVEITWGNAFFLSKRTILAADFFLYTPDPQFIEFPTQWTWNASLGLEWYATTKMPFRFGLFTNNANTPAIQDGATDQSIHVNQYGAALGISFIGPQSSITLTGTGTYGGGQGQIVSSSVAIQSIKQYSATFYLAASYQL